MAARLLLVDTGVFYATADASDQYRARAVAEQEQIAHEGWELAAPVSTICETHRLILQHLSPYHAHRWLAVATDSVGLLCPTESDMAQAYAVLHRFHDQPLTLFDTLLYVLSERLAAPIWTYDHHFDILRARRWLG
jgi:predicted nucleic acid-binding protein